MLEPLLNGILNLFALQACRLPASLSVTTREAVTIYILIPQLLVPQIMLGGAVVSFEELKSREAGHTNTPLIADLIPSRWGLEALLVRQYACNRFERDFFDHRCAQRQNLFMVDSYITEARGLADYPFLDPAPPDHQAQTARRLRALAAALQLIQVQTGLPSDVDASRLFPGEFNRLDQKRIKSYLERAEEYYLTGWKKAAKSLEHRQALLKQHLGP